MPGYINVALFVLILVAIIFISLLSISQVFRILCQLRNMRRKEMKSEANEPIYYDLESVSKSILVSHSISN